MATLKPPKILIKLWVDDLRTPPDDTWIWAKTSKQALKILAEIPIEEMSLDHDLGGDDTTRPIILWLCEHPGSWPDNVSVHSANPVGRQWLEGMVVRYHEPRGTRG